MFGIENFDHPERINHYIKLKDNIINLENMNYPCGNRQIDILEENNQGIVSINVFEEIEFNGVKSIAIYRRTKVRNAKYHINLLKITNEDGKCHLVYLKNNRLIGSQTNTCKTLIKI